MKHLYLSVEKVYGKQFESDLSGYFHLQMSFASQGCFLKKERTGRDC